ncbi:hypothetical protein SEA_DATBOI_135 [Gordonia phage DatBoi]|nr:hypothetical protein SEA_DATBOI_135 [Gordonia phage DatBoi]
MTTPRRKKREYVIYWRGRYPGDWGDWSHTTRIQALDAEGAIRKLRKDLVAEYEIKRKTEIIIEEVLINE